MECWQVAAGIYDFCMSKESSTPAGTRSTAPWAHPLDGVGQHLYMDQGELTSATKIEQYLQDVRKAYVAFEGEDTPKENLGDGERADFRCGG